MERMLKESSQRVAQQDGWIKARRAQIAASLSRLDVDFEKLGSSGRQGAANR
jgi:argininosuccinate lyase